MNHLLPISIILSALLLSGSRVYAEDGYQLWLRYAPIETPRLAAAYRQLGTQVSFPTSSETLRIAQAELVRGLTGMTGSRPVVAAAFATPTLVAGTPDGSGAIRQLSPGLPLEKLGKEGFIITIRPLAGRQTLVVAANTDIGVMYGVFRLLMLMQQGYDLTQANITEVPRCQLRLLNHWDNLTRYVERGYAGQSIWDWHKLPDYLYPRYTDYARANASIGINGTVLTNVNANAEVLTTPYLQKVQALAAIFRPYGIKVYLTARFSAPVEIGGLPTADPLDPAVRAWWHSKAAEIYALIPDFGGFVVKANSEGQPGPQNYGRSHAEGANMLAEAIAPHGGIVMWRAFVYSHEAPEDRAKQAYSEFKPLDGQFLPNVFVQVKNGPVDFQPREPFHPLFGAMPRTPLMMEFQITKEYLGFATHLVYLAPLYRETLGADTYAGGPGTTVAEIVDGTFHAYKMSGMAGVSNIGTDRNWCGSHFDQANWYAFGRLAWDHSLSAETVASEWIKATFGLIPGVNAIQRMMMMSREAAVQYMTPLGLHHLMGWGHHYGPAPWLNHAERPDWNSTYYHKADSAGIGFDRSPAGSGATDQYHAPVAARWADPRTCPENLLLWFHHLDWTYRMQNGRMLWDELCYQYSQGVDSVRFMLQTWEGLEDQIDPERFADVRTFLQIQLQEAIWWRSACLLYFQQYARLPLPAGLEPLTGTLETYQQQRFRYAPGN
ncbi:MAG: alpha-glucuronidase family glycosyl hydrolase [Bacteroidia bacterium]|nr:alpha-glucuronidase family glycosyl hydrolase [Bacteroidia bacterium]